MKLSNLLIFCVLLALNFFGCSSQTSTAPLKSSVAYYIDSQYGNDLNSGLSADKPFKSLSKAASLKLSPGDSLRFKRGSAYSGTIIINNSGSLNKPITVTDYGTNTLPAPSFTNPNFDADKGNYGNCIRLKGSFIIVENLYFHHTVAQLPSTTGGFTVMWELGALYIEKSAENSIVRNNEFYDCGVGIKSYGRYALIDNNYIHDCNRVLKEWSWGPIGIWLGADFQEVSNNRIFNYKAIDPRIIWGPNSYGGGADGGAIEIDDARVDKSNISIHHNYTRDCQGFLEVTWSDIQQNPTYTNFKIHHNVSDDYQQFVALWRGAGCRIENNTIIRRKRNVNDWGVFNITQLGAKNTIKNNIVIVENDIIIFNLGRNGNSQPDNIISNNLYFAASGELKMGLEGPGQSPIFANPLLYNYVPGLSAGDFAITANSPAKNRGLDLGYKLDFLNIVIPQDGVADIGAFEFKIQ